MYVALSELCIFLQSTYVLQSNGQGSQLPASFDWACYPNAVDIDRCHEVGLLKPAVTLVMKYGNKVLLQQRKSTKRVFPSMFDFACSGHVNTQDLVEVVQAGVTEVLPQDQAVAVQREASEEIHDSFACLEASRLKHAFSMELHAAAGLGKEGCHCYTSVYIYDLTSEEAGLQFKLSDVQGWHWVDFKELVCCHDPSDRWSMIPRPVEYWNALKIAFCC